MTDQEKMLMLKRKDTREVMIETKQSKRMPPDYEMSPLSISRCDAIGAGICLVIQRLMMSGVLCHTISNGENCDRLDYTVQIIITQEVLNST